MRRRALAALLLALAALAGCTTSFDLGDLRARDAGTDGGADAPAVTGCSAEGDRCCVDDAGTRCGPGLVCGEGVCQRCPGSLAACLGACVDITRNAAHCGGCGRRCEDGEECRGGTCALACAAGLVACGGACVDPLRNAAHCGRCGNACGAGESCVAGGCALSCESPSVVCSGRCVNLGADPANCGRCAHACVSPNAEPRCAAGACAAGACNVGYGDCDGNAANGCETDLITTAAHCGACGRRCALPHAQSDCTTGRCVVRACEGGWSDCDGDATNGCEADTSRDVTHCGSCTNACPTTGPQSYCADGRCARSNLGCTRPMADCDGMVASGCESNLATNVNNCGGCGRACTGANATMGCMSDGAGGGRCVVVSCAAGYANCDGDAANGCETDTRVDPNRCGGCNTRCELAGATASCVGGACAVRACTPGRADCDGRASNGCEADLAADPAHCGACGSACRLTGATAACASGRCQVASCAPLRGDCDGVDANGCEASLAADVANCGRCGAYCATPHGTPSCVDGACRVGACEAGFADCDGVAANGCEVDTRTSLASCGACGRACSPANAAGECADGACRVARCNLGFADCDADPANGCETDTRSSPASCGACGRACAAGTACQAGACVSTCPAGTTRCGGACVDTQADPRNCGACGSACPTAPNGSFACEAGRCALRCANGYGDCDGSTANGCEARLDAPANCLACGVSCPNAPNGTGYCEATGCAVRCAPPWTTCGAGAPCATNLSSDPANCGECGRACPAPANGAAVCEGGVCGARCNQGFATCGEARACATNLGNDSSNCGACGVVCPRGLVPRGNATGACAMGRCVVMCTQGAGNCDGAASNGCEVNLQCSPNHCGMCGRRCDAGETCCNGMCVRDNTVCISFNLCL